MLLSVDSLEDEEAYLVAQHQVGAHRAIRNPSMRIFWFRYLPKHDEPSFEVFWTHFPKGFDRLLLDGKILLITRAAEIR